MVGSAWLGVDSGPIYCGERSGPSETVWERGGKSGLDLEITERAVGQTAESQMLASSTLPHIKWKKKSQDFRYRDKWINFTIYFSQINPSTWKAFLIWLEVKPDKGAHMWEMSCRPQTPEAMWCWAHLKQVEKTQAHIEASHNKTLKGDAHNAAQQLSDFQQPWTDGPFRLFLPSAGSSLRPGWWSLQSGWDVHAFLISTPEQQTFTRAA